MKVNLPLTFPIIVRFIIYRDVLCIFLLSNDYFPRRSYSFRLTEDFWLNNDAQLSYWQQFLALVQKDSEINLLINDKLIPTDLSNNIHSYELIVRKNIDCLKGISENFNLVYVRDFTNFSRVFEKFQKEDYLYLDYDVDYLGVFAKSTGKNVGGYWNLDYLFYESLGLGSFLESSIFDLDVRSSKQLFTGLKDFVQKYLGKKNLNFEDFSNLYLGGITSKYFDYENMLSNSLFKQRIQIDNNYEQLLRDYQNAT